MKPYLIFLIVLNGILAASGPSGGAVRTSNLPGRFVVSGNENKIDLTSGVATAVPDAPPDNLSILDFSVFPPLVEHVSDIPNSVIGPPSNVAITPDGRLLFVADSVEMDPQTKTNSIPRREIRVLDLTRKPPTVIQRLTAGRQPSGICISPDGANVLVANRADGTVTLMRIAGAKVTPIESVTICSPAESVSDVAIHPNGRLALASVQKGGYLSVLEIDGDHLRVGARKISVYGQPYRVMITPDGELGFTAGQGAGNGLDKDALSVVDLRQKEPQTCNFVPLASGPESFDISPDGQWIAAVLMNGSNLPKGSPNYSTNGTLIVLKRQGMEFRRVQEIATGRIPEGVAFAAGGRYLVVQCHPDRELWIFERRRGGLRDTGVRIAVPGMPSSLRASP